MAKIIILAGQVQSGKTTTLMEWIKERSDVTGFLCPDIDGIRNLYMIESNILLPFEVKNENVEPTIHIGRFIFYTSGFESVKKWLKKTVDTDKRWVIIDEIGKLELEDNGFEPELTQFIDTVRYRSEDITLIIVVREQLKDKMIDKYKLWDAEIVPKTYFLQHLTAH